jgi:Uma2 family endonuclease
MIATAPTLTEERLLTFEEFVELPLSDSAELVSGHIVELSRNNPSHSKLVAAFAEVLRGFVRKTKSGEVFAGDVAVITKRNPDTGRGADLAFVSHERLAGQPEGSAALEVAPDLIVEVISPSNSWDDVMAKMTEYFAIGVRQVWIATPSTQTIHIYESLTSMRGHSLQSEPILTTAVLPGLELDLHEIFG